MIPKWHLYFDWLLFVRILWHINHYGLFNAKSGLDICELYMTKHVFVFI